MLRTMLAVLVLACLTGHAAAQDRESKTYRDAQGRDVHFPMGALSFADTVVSFSMGRPAPQSQPARRQSNALGEPVNSSLSLGCGGRLTLSFDDNALVDVPGPDLYVFEIGPKVESTWLEMSTDGQNWTDVGAIEGATAEVDISGKGAPGTVYRYVRLTDRNQNCKAGRYSGADIDAVGAIGSAIRIALSGEILFDFDRFDLRSAARVELDLITKVLGGHPGAAVVIEGHTDARGSSAYNRKLSSERALSVAEYLIRNAGLSASRIRAAGYGETRPVASNRTETGRQKNRRVDVYILPRGKLR